MEFKNLLLHLFVLIGCKGPLSDVVQRPRLVGLIVAEFCLISPEGHRYWMYTDTFTLDICLRAHNEFLPAACTSPAEREWRMSRAVDPRPRLGGAADTTGTCRENILLIKTGRKKKFGLQQKLVPSHAFNDHYNGKTISVAKFFTLLCDTPPFTPNRKSLLCPLWSLCNVLSLQVRRFAGRSNPHRDIPKPKKSYITRAFTVSELFSGFVDQRRSVLSSAANFHGWTHLCQRSFCVGDLFRHPRVLLECVALSAKQCHWS